MTEAKHLTTGEAAQRLAVTPRQVRAMIYAGRLPAQRAGRDWQIRPEDLELVKDLKPKPPEATEAEPPATGPHSAQGEVVECPACAGEGQIFPGVETDLWDGRLRWPDALQAETCDLCQGVGEVDPKTAAAWAAAELAALEAGDQEGTD
ncbi:MAG: helix-turn-helix domain-containing protein [Anaerolineae bacterium]|jgi:excisionase family DNA binding protein